MLVSDFRFELPDPLIARYPAEQRDASRLMVLERQGEQLHETTFGRLGDWVRPGDLLVVNDTRVIPARLFGRKPSGGRVEIFLVEQVANHCWRCLLRSSKPCRPGQAVVLSGGVTALVEQCNGDEGWLVSFSGYEDFNSWLEQVGQMPIPPYLGRESEALDRERYQTVYAGQPGAVAAPTAGLHFTPELMENLQQQGIAVAQITLHVGLGTFQPVRVERVHDHRIHRERYRIPEETVTAIQATRQAGGRVICVGTTVARTLEYAADQSGTVQAGAGEADIFIYPGYHFKVVDALLTNFHLPESTLLMLVAAFAGREFALDAYGEAVRRGFRFYSYGDAMLIV